MGDIFVYLSLFILFFGCLLISGAVLKRLIGRTTIFEYERGLKYRHGKLQGILNPGSYWTFNSSTKIVKIDLRPTYLTIAGQEILSQDGISLKISVATQYAVQDPVKAIHSTENYQQAVYLILQLAIRELLGSAKIDDILAKRQDIGKHLLETVSAKINQMGLNIFSVDVKDLIFPGDIKKTFIQVVQAQKEALAALEKARGETAVLRHLANAAKMLENNPALLDLRTLQALSQSNGNSLNVYLANKVKA